jgi:hypothetical protein
MASAQAHHQQAIGYIPFPPPPVFTVVVRAVEHHALRRHVAVTRVHRPAVARRHADQHVAEVHEGGATLGGRPRAWCGYFARGNFLGRDPGPEYNLASNWRRLGEADSQPHSGDVVVWPHHVGKIVGECHGAMCPVWSGNDGGAVRTRVRSVAGAIFRRV